MSLTRIFAGLVLALAMILGFSVWASYGFLAGAIAFIGGAVIAGKLHNSGTKEVARFVNAPHVPAPADFVPTPGGGAPVPACPKCQAPTTWVVEHSRHLCSRCSVYV